MSTFHLFPTHDELAEMHPQITARIDRQHEWYRRQGFIGHILWNAPRALIGAVIVLGVVMVFHTSKTTEEAVNRICAFPPNYLLFYLVAYYTFLWRTELFALRIYRRLFRRQAPQQAPTPEPERPVRNRLKAGRPTFRPRHRNTFIPADLSRN